MKTIYKTNPKRILGYLMAFAMVLFSTNAFSQCDHTLNMYDSWGDGWNGSAVDVTVNGAVVVAGATITAAQGSANSETFSAASGDAIDLANWVTGSYTSEVSWDITDGDGTVIASGVHNGSGASTAYCAPPVPCGHTLNMYDSWGDGWNGSAVDVTVNGAVVVAGATITMAQGAANSESFSAASGDAIDLANWVTGSYTSEVSWDITDGGGAIIASGVHAGSGASSGNCPSVIPGCTDPTASNYNASATVDDGSCVWINPPTCCNTAQYGAGMAPASGVATISTCNYLSEYSPISGCVAGQLYTLEISGANAAPGWIVVTEGTSCGNMIAEGPSPLEFTAGTDPNIFAHWMADSCVTALGCHVTTITFGSYVYGCTNPLATNYDPSATHDDGSCVLAGCTSGIGANSESFETGTLYSQGPWAEWVYDAATSTFTGTNGWRRDNLGTGSSGTGPTNGAASLDGDFYLYCETSGQYGKVANLHSSCVDLASFGDPTFVAGYNMEGATMGTLNIDVSTDGGTSWNNEWTMSGNQGAGWNEAIVSLSAYSGQMVQVRMNYTSGTSYTGDCAIDFLRFMEAPASGCMDPLACNYDPSATIDDGSCYTLAATAAVTDVSCNGGSDGSASVSGNATLSSILWGGGETTATISGLVAGTYTVTVTDATGCSASATAVVAEPAVLSLSALVGNESAAGANDGSIDLSVSGGTACQTSATTTAGAHASNYNGYARGWSFTAQTSGNISHVQASDGNTTLNLTEQSLEILDITDPANLVSLFYAQNAATGWLTCNVTMVAGNTYAIIGAKHINTPPAFGMANSYGGSGQSFVIDGVSTPVMRVGAQGNLSVGQVGAGGGAFLAPVAGSIGRLDIMTGVPGAQAYTYAWSNGASSEDISGLTAGSYSVTATDCNGCSATASYTVITSATPGCTDSTANNYNPLATIDDGSCFWNGCTDPLASNYNSTATVDDGSCVYPCSYYGQEDITVVVTTNPWPGEVSWDITDASGAVVASSGGAGTGVGTFNICLAWGCYNFNMHDSYGDGWNGSVYTVSNSGNGTVYSTGTLATGLTGTNAFCMSAAVPGCTNAAAGNYNPAATVDDGSCCLDNWVTLNMTDAFGDGWNGNTWTATGGTNTYGPFTLATGLTGSESFCMTDDCYDIVCDFGAWQSEVGWTLVDASGATIASGGAPYNAQSAVGSGSCGTPGCMDSTACNYNSAATIDDGSCILPDGCTDPLALNYNSSALCDDGSCTYYVAVLGCMDALASNFDPSANEGCCGDWAAGTWMNGCPNGACGGNAYVIGVANDGSWSMDTMWWDSSPSTVVDPTTGYVTITSVYIGDMTSCEYTGVATSTNVSTHDPANGYAIVGTVSFTVTGTGGFSYSSLGTFTGVDAAGNLLGTLAASAGSGTNTSCCVYPVPGCTDPLATNYNALATVDDGSCVYPPVPGCMDSLASNYNSAATVDDGSCLYPCTDNDVTIVVGGGSYDSEITWDLTDGSGAIVASGAAPVSVTACLPDDCYTMNMYDSWGDGWNGATWTITDNNSAVVYGTGTLASGLVGSALVSIGTACPVYGCMNPAATNYNPLATVDDGSCILGPSMCCNTMAYGAAVAPTVVGVPTTISTCNYLSEHSPISDVCGGASYTLSVTGANANPGWISVYSGSSCGTLVAEGPSPLTWTAAVSGTHYAHWHADGSCATAGGCHVTTITYDGGATSGCTNPLASNYDPSACVDDGSCLMAGCTSGIGANSESFEVGTLYSQGPWAEWVYDAATSTFTGTNGWRRDNLGTGSSGTGPTNGAPSLDGDFYLYCETSGQYGKVANLHSSCVDLASFGDPTFVAGYHMAGATMGTLNIDVSTDGGGTWNNEWTMSGDQGTSWLEAVVSLSAYSGQIVQVRMNYTSGTSFTGDCAIDYLRFMEAPASGCMDPLACNYDPSATIDDGSCYILAATAAVTDVSCNGGSDGSASVSANAALSSILWGGGETTATISGLVAGTYTVTVTDATGCSASATAVVAEPAVLSLSAVIGNESAAGANDGQIDLSVSGGTACQTSATVLCGPHMSAYNSTFTRGWYFQAQSSFTVSDLRCPDDAAPGVATNQTVAIVDYGTTSPVVPFALPSAAAHGNSFAAYDVAGGWVNIPGGFQVIAGNYYGLIGAAHAPGSTTLNNSYGAGGQMIVLDGIPTLQGRLGIQGGIGAYAASGNVLPSNTTWGTPVGSIGRIDMMTGVVGAQAYNYAWSTGDTTEDISGISAGAYSVTVTDCNGCSTTGSYTVITSATPGCMDPLACNYNSFATVDDGSCTYAGCTDSLACNYDPTAGCDDGSCYNLVGSASATDASCNGGNDGSATASSNGSASSYAWGNGATTATISGLSAGTYTCTITDGACSAMVTAIVGEPAAISLSAVVVDESAAGNDGSIDLSVSGGTPCITVATLNTPQLGGNGQSGTLFNVINTSGAPLTITGFSQGGPTAINNGPMEVWMQTGPAVYGSGPLPLGAPPYAGTYDFVLVGSANVTISGGSLGLIPVSGVTLAAGETRAFRVQLTVGTLAYTNGTGTPGVTAWASDANVTVTEGHGGAVSGWFAFSPRNFNGAIHYGGGGAAYTFAWSNGASSEDISGLAAGSYSVTATDCNGCSATASYTVAGSVVLGCMDPLACNYDSTATVDDGSCTYAAANEDCAGNCLSGFVLWQGSCVTPNGGCMDTTALNYYAGATFDDGSCVYPNPCGQITGVNMTDVIHDRATFNWDDMNNATCVVDQIRIQYREVGTSTYALKTMGAPVGNNAPCLNTSKRVLNLSASTQYEYDFKIWYQDGTIENWHAGGTFTTAAACVNATNVTATPVNTTKTSFCWTAPASPYSFVRLQYRENVPGSSFSNIGGFGVMAPALCKDKNGLTPGLQYRVMWRTWCNATGGPYRSPVWDGPVIWDQPSSIRVEGGTTINNLDVYPNPSRDIFNVTFTSEDVQDLDVRVLNIVGEVVYTENLEQFVGEYTKAIDLATYTKGIYFLEITTNNGVINKKLILQ